MPRSPEELRKHRLIGHLRPQSSRPSDWQFRHGTGTRALRLPMALSFNTTEALLLSALEGQGIVQQLDLLVGGYLAEGRLVELLRDHSCEGPSFRWSTRARRNTSRRCVCSPSSPPISCASTRRAWRATPPR